MLGHLPLLADPQDLQRFLLRVERDALNVQLQGDAAQLRAVVKIVHPQLPQAAKAPKDTAEGRQAGCPGLPQEMDPANPLSGVPLPVVSKQA